MLANSPCTYIVCNDLAVKRSVATLVSYVFAVGIFLFGVAALPVNASPRGSDPLNMAGTAPIAVSVTPTTAGLVSLGTSQFTATVSNTADTGGTWKATAGLLRPGSQPTQRR